MNITQKIAAYHTLKKELEWLTGFMDSNEAIFTADKQRYELFKKEWGERVEICKEKIAKLGL